MPWKRSTLGGLGESWVEAWPDSWGEQGVSYCVQGDGYMMAGNLLKKMKNGARAVVECGLEMLEVLKEINASHGSRLSLEQTTGVNTGNVVAGVLGYTTVAFDIWGDAVNCASRMESNSIPSVVQVCCCPPSHTDRALPTRGHWDDGQRGTG